MATWVVGDVQGCKKPLKRLLKRLSFDWERDLLWSTGDIVNRGPKCLKTLRYFYKHRDRIRLVLGNHDLHLLALRAGVREMGSSDTLGEILAAPDRDLLLDWLQQQPLMYWEDGFTLVHAGIPPQWTLAEAAQYAREVETVLRGEDAGAFFAAMYGNEPSIWSDDLSGATRLRVITNYFTRMRYCYPDGRLDLVSKGPLSDPGGPGGVTSGTRRVVQPRQPQDRRGQNHLRPLGVPARPDRPGQHHRYRHGLRVGLLPDRLLPGDRRAGRGAVRQTLAPDPRTRL
jgi:bis(5'-nucleosyl)-tetraphosphatase (symmetrical)